MASGAIRLRLLRIIETPSIVAGDAAEQVGVVMVLSAKKILILRDFVGQADLVTGRAELGAAMKILEESLFVERRLALHELAVDPLEDRIAAFAARPAGAHAPASRASSAE